MDRPNGKLILVGGAEDKGTDLEEHHHFCDNHPFFELGILRCIVREIPHGTQPQIEVVTTASSEPRETFDTYRNAFNKLGCPRVGHLNIHSREEAEDDETIRRLAACNCILFSGGDQLRLAGILGGTDFIDRVKERYKHDHLVIAGTSAGAMVMSNPMIYEGAADRAKLKGEVKIASGLGLIEEVIIDTHVDKRGRFGRLAQAVAVQPGALGLGLAEDTGVIVSRGRQMEVIGSGNVIVVDGRQIQRTNIAEIEEGKPIAIEHLVVHIMAAGEKYDTQRRCVIRTADESPAS